MTENTTLAHSTRACTSPAHNLMSQSNHSASIDQGKAVFTGLPTRIQQALGQSQRIVLIANNPSITTETLDALLHPDDLLVLFNHFIHADYFATSPKASSLAKLLFFRQIGDSMLHFGLPPRHNNLPSIIKMANQAPTGFLFSNIAYQYPRLQDDPSPDDDPIDEQVLLEVPDSLRLLLDNPAHSRVLSEDHAVVADYPYFADIHSSAPSSGFLLYRVMLALRHYMQHSQERSLELVLIGFNHDDKTNHFWAGHNWAFERQALTPPPNGVRVIQQY